MGHTKGNWLISKRDGHSNGVRPVIHTMDTDRIAVISYRGVSTIKEADANARLIAAAPDLLEACTHGAMSNHHSACSHGKRGDGNTCECHVGKCQKAIAKAN